MPKRRFFLKSASETPVRNQDLSIPDAEKAPAPAQSARNVERIAPTTAPAAFRAADAAQFNPIGVTDGIARQIARISEAFAPAQPITNARFFAGRQDTLTRIITSIEEYRNHVLLFGPRGRGKTSLAMSVLSLAREAHYCTSYVSCSAESTLESLFRPVLAKIPRRFDAEFDQKSDGAKSAPSFLDIMQDRNWTPQDLSEVLVRVTGTRVVAVFDEFDRHENPMLMREMSEVIKSLSDQGARVSMIIVGVGDTPERLLSEHHSIIRAVYSVKLDLMDDQAIVDILTSASRAANISIAHNVAAGIAKLARGKPFIARLIGLESAKSAAIRQSDAIMHEDMVKGVRRLQQHLQSSDFNPIETILRGGGANADILRAIARCHRGPHDLFTLDDVLEALAAAGRGRPSRDVAARLLESFCDVHHILERNTDDEKPALRMIDDPRLELAMAVLAFDQPPPPSQKQRVVAP